MNTIKTTRAAKKTLRDFGFNNATIKMLIIDGDTAATNAQKEPAMSDSFDAKTYATGVRFAFVWQYPSGDKFITIGDHDTAPHEKLTEVQKEQVLKILEKQTVAISQSDNMTETLYIRTSSIKRIADWGSATAYYTDFQAMPITTAGVKQP